ncbi:MAG: large subunit ribosomal protein L10 [Rickettsiales bacterium]|jgi:large subunit ribosomal protein L10
MNRTQKADLVSSMRESLTQSSFVLLLHYRGLSDKQLFDFRLNLKSKGVSLKIIKNTLAKVAIKDSDLEVLTPYLTGPTAICYTNDIVSLAKIATDSAKEHESLKIQIGYLNKSILSQDAIDNLSKLGSLEEVRSSFLSVLQGSQSHFVRVLNAPATGIISVINNYTDSKK